MWRATQALALRERVEMLPNLLPNLGAFLGQFRGSYQSQTSGKRGDFEEAGADRLGLTR
jgi:hypothetical protein